MEIIFLLAGLLFIAVGAGITLYEIRSRKGTQSIKGRVVGFSTGRHNKPTSPSFHSVAQYVGPDGQNYFVEGAVGSSCPLHAVGDSVTILVDSVEPAKAVLKSALSFVIGGFIGLLGLASVLLFRLTFRADILSLAMAAIVLVGIAFKIKAAWRKEPMSLKAWQEYKKQILAPRVFTDQSRDQISWADSISVRVARENYRKSQRFAVPFLLVLGGGSLFLGYHFYGKTQAFIAKADQAAGRVVGLHLSDSSADSPTYAAVVEFTDQQGQAHKFVDSLISSPPFYQAGQSVHVLYDRVKPSDARIDRGTGNYWLSLVSGAAGVLFLLMGAHSAKRRFRS